MNSISRLPGNKRLAFLFGHLHKGGMQKAVSNISLALPDDLEQFIVFFGTEDPGFEYNGTLVDLHVPGDSGYGVLKKLGNFFKRIIRLQRLVDRHHLETVISFGEQANLINVLTRRKRAILCVRVSLEEFFDIPNLSPLRRFYSLVYRKLIRLFYRKAHLIIAVTERIAEQLVSHYAVPRNKICIIYNLYDIAKIRTLAAKPLDPGMAAVLGKPTVVNVGSLIFQKGQEHLIRAFALARQQAPDLQLVIIGGGELQDFLNSLAQELHVDDAVHFLGFQPNPYKFMARATLFVLPSRFEGFPNVLVEAMICGLPVIATDCPTGPREIIGESTYGILLPDLNHEEAAVVEQIMAAWMVKLLQPETGHFYREQAGIRCAVFSQKRIIQQWLGVLGHEPASG